MKGGAKGMPKLGLRSQGSEGAGDEGISSKFIIKQHPSGDRYIVTARSTQPPSSPTHSMNSERSMRSAPGAIEGLENRDYAQYYKSWKQIATSKTEKDAEAMLESIQRSPMSRFVQGGGSRPEGYLTHKSFQTTRYQAPKPMTYKDKKKQELEKMKRNWSVKDLSADIHNSLSAEDFLNQSDASAHRPSSSRCQSRKGSRERRNAGRSQGSQGDWVKSKKGMRGQAAEGQRAYPPAFISQQVPHRVPGIGIGSPDSSMTEDLNSSRLSQASSRGLATQAREALATLGIERPLSSRRSTAMSSQPYSPSSPVRVLTGDSRSQTFRVPGMPAVHENMSTPPTGLGSLRDDQISEANPSFQRRMEGGRPLPLPPKPLELESSQSLDSPIRKSTPAAMKSSPAESDKWEAELEELLEWTAGLGPLPETL